MLTDHFPDAAICHRVEGLIELGPMARAGLGVAMIGCFAADPDPGLSRVYPEPVTDAAMDLWVLTHPDLARVARVREFMRFISDAMLADRDLFMGRLA
jgi:DNA-binding transcriptional LysR family regulator